jgi:hypothetical protein
VLTETGQASPAPPSYTWNEVTPSPPNQQQVSGSPHGHENVATEARASLQGHGRLVQSLTATPALLCSPIFAAEGGEGEPAGLQQGLVEAVISGRSPIVGLRRVHKVCGRALQRASFGLGEFFLDEPFEDEPAFGEKQPAKRQCTGKPEGVPLLHLTL